MRGFYAIQPRGWPGKPIRSKAAMPDPYAPGTPDFADRNAEVVTELSPGVTRIDLGLPLGTSVPRRVSARPAEAPKESALPAPVTSQPKAPTGRSWKDDYGVARDP
jgi:hypothetical protein